MVTSLRRLGKLWWIQILSFPRLAPVALALGLAWVALCLAVVSFDPFPAVINLEFLPGYVWYTGIIVLAFAAWSVYLFAFVSYGGEYTYTVNRVVEQGSYTKNSAGAVLIAAGLIVASLLRISATLRLMLLVLDAIAFLPIDALHDLAKDVVAHVAVLLLLILGLWILIVG
jgi:hypothetical protein